MDTKPVWAPMIGFNRASLEMSLTPGSADALEMAAMLEIVRRRICDYSSGHEDARCDCKYGVAGDLLAGADNPFRRQGEKTGCPELRALVTYLIG